MTEVKDDKKTEIKQEENPEMKNDAKTKKKSKTKQKSKDIQLRRNRALTSLSPMTRFFNEMTRFFDEYFWRPFDFFFPEAFDLALMEDKPFFRTPLANIVEKGDRYEIKAELPGLDKGDLEITIHDGMLEIKGEKKEEHEEKKKGYLRREYSSSSYFRCFKLPDNIDEDKIDASLKQGLLKITLPKKEIEQKEKKKINVK